VLEDIDARGMAANVDWFRRTLLQHGVSIHPDSEVEASLRRAEEWGRLLTSEVAAKVPRARAPELYRQGIGWDFLIRALHRGLQRGFAPRWELFKANEVLITAMANQSRDRDLVLEVLTAAVCSTFCSGVDNIEPQDVVLQHGGIPRVIECKNLYSTRIDQHRAAIVDAAKQVQRATAERGYALVNLVNLVPHEEFFPATGPAPFASSDALLARVDAWARDFANQVFSNRDFVQRLAIDRTTGVRRDKLRAVVFLVPTVADVQGRAVNVFRLAITPCADDPADRAFEQALHVAFQDAFQHRITVTAPSRSATSPVAE
jgi:hypothetical protein